MRGGFFFVFFPPAVLATKIDKRRGKALTSSSAMLMDLTVKMSECRG